MTAALIAFAIAAVGASIALAALAIRYGGVSADLAGARADLKAANLARDTALEQAKLATASYTENRNRLEAIISGRDDELTKLEADLETCNDPQVMRDMLQRMLKPEVSIAPLTPTGPAK